MQIGDLLPDLRRVTLLPIAEAIQSFDDSKPLLIKQRIEPTHQCQKLGLLPVTGSLGETCDLGVGLIHRNTTLREALRQLCSGGITLPVSGIRLDRRATPHRRKGHVLDLDLLARPIWIGWRRCLIGCLRRRWPCAEQQPCPGDRQAH